LKVKVNVEYESYQVEESEDVDIKDSVGTFKYSSGSITDSPDSCMMNENFTDKEDRGQADANTTPDRDQTEKYNLNDTPGRVQADDSITTIPDSPDSGLGMEKTKASLSWPVSLAVDSLPDSFSGIVTNIEIRSEQLWLVPRDLKPQQRLLNSLLASISRRLGEPGVGVENKEVTVSEGDGVLAWWEADKGWFRAKVVESHMDTSITVLFIDWGNTEQLPLRQVVVPDPGLAGYTTLARLPGLAVLAMLYGFQVENLEEEDKKRLHHLMDGVQTATGSWDSMAQFTVCHRQPLHCMVQYQHQESKLHLNLAGVLVAGKFAFTKVPSLTSSSSPPPSPLPWQFKHSWPGQVTCVQGDQVWVVPVPLSDQFGLSDTDWYIDRSVQLLTRLHIKLDSQLLSAHQSSSGRQVSSLSRGQTVIWCDRGTKEKYYRGVVRDQQAQSTMVTIFLPDYGRVETVERSSLATCPAQLCVWPARAVRVVLSSSGALPLAMRKGVVLVTVLKGDMTAHVRSPGGGFF